MLINQYSLYIRDDSSMVSELRNIVSPSFCQPDDESIVPFQVCNVEHMTCEQTALWVWTFCHHKRWDEAARYAQSFKEQEITGTLLIVLDHELLWKCMKITNHTHRDELLSVISDLFSKSPFPIRNVASVVKASVCTPDSHCGIIYPERLVTSILDSNIYDSQHSLNTVVGRSDCESSVISASASRSADDIKFECGNSIQNMTRLSNSMGERSDFNSATALSHIGSFGSDMATHVQTDVSLVSDSECGQRSSWTGCMNVHGLDMPSQSLDYSKPKMHHRKTRDNEKLNMPASVQLRMLKPFSNKKSRSVNLKKLILKLKPDQIPESGGEDKIEKIRSWFVKLDSAVIVKPMEDKENIYTIIFRDVDAANEALKFKSKGFDIRNKYPPRACPGNHIKYKALADLIIRKGKSFRGHFFKGFVKRGESVWVDQVKGRRARVMNRGWVSLYTMDGIPLLVQEGNY